MTDGDKLMRLWTHEVYRVFYDRLIDDKDRHQFFEIVKEMLHQYFKMNADKLLGHLATSGKLVDDDVRYVYHPRTLKPFFLYIQIICM